VGVHTHVDRAQDLLAAWRPRPSGRAGEELETEVEQLNAALFEHLDHEEREILPLAEQYVSVEE
jgi:hypothetical protein